MCLRFDKAKVQTSIDAYVCVCVRICTCVRACVRAVLMLALLMQSLMLEFIATSVVEGVVYRGGWWPGPGLGRGTVTADLGLS